MNKRIRYRVYGIIDLDADNPGEITSILDNICGWGTAEIVGVELVDEDAELPKVQDDLAARGA